MQRTFVLVSIAATVAACADAREPRTDSAGQAIVNGTVVAAGADLATVYLDLGGGTCSGTLISPKVVLTAKHCTEGTSPSSVWAMFGHVAADDGDWIQAAAIANHPSTDIAVIALAEPGPATPIPLWEEAYTEATLSTPVRIVGFGVTGENQSDSGRKRHGMTALYDYDGEVMYVGATGSKTCYGDSGGSAFISKDGVEYIAGVISFGTDVCEAGLSGQMRVDVNLPWIRDFVEANDPATCDADDRCAMGCPAPDPDCACAVDGYCTAECADPVSDPDCEGCGGDGACREDCPAPDPDCGGGGGGGGGGDGDGGGDGEPAVVTGGCASHGGGGGGLVLALCLALLVDRRVLRCARDALRRCRRVDRRARRVS